VAVEGLTQWRAARMQADARGVPANLMLSRMILIGATVVLVLFGLVMVFSASSIEAISDDLSIFYYVGKQAVFAAAGGILAYLIAKFLPYQVWQSNIALYVGVVVAYLLLFAVIAFGTTTLGAKRWLYIGSFSMQPSEFVKIILVVAMAKLLYDYRDGRMGTVRFTLGVIICVVLPLFILYRSQSDMGTAMIIIFGILAVLWLGEVPARYIVGVFVLLAIAGVAALSVGYRSDRIAVWLNPWNDGQNGYGTGYQTIRSFYAFAEGGLFGVGLGNSHEKFLYLPEAETDFIFSIIGEELGLVGCVFVIALFMVFLWAGLRIAQDAPDMFGKMLAGSMTVMIVGQALLNMACATGLFPTTGKPLPFISSGGSSIIASLVIVGLILSVSYGSNVLTEPERRRNNLDVVYVEGGRGRRASGRASDRASGRATGRGEWTYQGSRGAGTGGSRTRRGDGGRGYRSDGTDARPSRTSAGVGSARGRGSDGRTRGSRGVGDIRLVGGSASGSSTYRRPGRGTPEGRGSSRGHGTSRTHTSGRGTSQRGVAGTVHDRHDDFSVYAPRFDSAFPSTDERRRTGRSSDARPDGSRRGYDDINRGSGRSTRSGDRGPGRGSRR
jgi:cell division protein FtsW